MKAFCLTLLILFTGNLMTQIPWQDPSMPAQGTEIPASQLRPYANVEAALSLDWRRQSDRHQLLNGDWDFFLTNSPADSPEGFFKPDFPKENGGSLPVPSFWQIHGHGQLIYLNKRQAFPPTPPTVPTQENETGHYRTRFRIPRQGRGMRKRVL